MAITESLIVELDAKVDKYNKKMGEAASKTEKLGASSVKSSESIAKLAFIAIGVAAAITAAASAANEFAKELNIAASRSGETVERMQELAFATGTVGISLEKLGDISKDTNEKIGEFLTTGGGGFVDFVDVMKLSGAEAKAAAIEFQNMSGPDVLQEMVKRMEDAGVSGQKMSFALEGVASDTTDLIPLLKDGARGLNDLTSEFRELGVTLSQEQLDRITSIGKEFKKLNLTFSSTSSALIAEYSEEIIGVIRLTQVLGETSTGVFRIIAQGWGNIIALAGAALNDLVNDVDTFDQVLLERTEKTFKVLNDLFRKNEEVTTAALKGGNIVNKKLLVDDKLTQDQKIKNVQKFTKVAGALNQAFFEDNKAVNAGLIIADTAAAIMASLRINPYDYFNVGILAATGLAQLGNLASASSGGGGSISEPSGGGTPQQQDFAPETTGLELSEATGAGSDVRRIEFSTDTGDDLINAIAQALNQGLKTGQFS